MIDNCQWCKFNKNGCGDKEHCDFKNLAYDEDAIVERINIEKQYIARVKDQVASGVDFKEEDLSEIVDKSQGIQIMADRLKEDFGYDDKKLKNLIQGEKMGFAKKIMIAKKLQEMKLRRKKR